MTVKELREKYLGFFESHGHKIIPGAPLIPENDPTVLFTTAGMHPLVPYLLGENHPAGVRLTNVQKCIRTGDIDEVGDDWHLTFFEMLGNWSLGDYFKQEAIEMSFKFLTEELGIPVEKLAFTCFEGDEAAGIPKDEEAAKIWESLGVSPLHIKFLGRVDNWWGPAGQTGPCGPDTEMFYWVGEDNPPHEFDPADKGWVEIWNDVFMQYNKTGEGKYEELSQKNVDTGMGLERTVAVLNNQKSVYETDKLYNILAQITSLFDLSVDELGLEQFKPVRIIADHLRAATFILTEGIEPSNVEHGYVLRKLIRRAIRYGRQLGIKEAFTHKIAEVVIAEMGGYYKELRERRDFIIEQLAREEEKFDKTLEKGLKELQRLPFGKIPNKFMLAMVSNTDLSIDDLKPREKMEITGKDIFNIVTTYGLPFEVCMDEISIIMKQLYFPEKKDYDVRKTPLGLKIIDEFNQEFAKHQELSRQGSEKKFKGGLADHGEQTTKLHTAAHLMLEALRRVLGDHVYQKGSNITAERLRFDFSHSEKLTDEQKQQVEDLVNEQIQKNLSVTIEEMSLEQAKEYGAMGVFEHKYGDKVKVYTIGDPSVGQAFSKEICGGPHVENIGELGHFKIKKEESSSSGVRRIKAVLE